jgi:C4-dicarboxylate transporter, DctQ subunit
MILKLLNRFEYYILAFLMIGTTALLFTNVMLRYFFHSALFWAEETLRYCIVWITFIGTATCVKENSHISLDVLHSILPVTKRKYLVLFVHFFVLISALILGIIAVKFVMDIKSTGQVSSTIGGFPMYIIYSAIPIGFFLTFLRSIEKIGGLFTLNSYFNKGEK